MSRDGERRLTVLSERASYQFSGIYSINELLRSAAAWLAEQARIDWDGYASRQEFIDAANGLCDRLDDALNLDEDRTRFRGIGVPKTPERNYPDIAGLSQQLARGTPWRRNFEDADFGFAGVRPELPTVRS